jgi:hypothetical protein
MSRSISIEELNKRIDNLINEYKSSAEEYFQEIGDEKQGNECLAKVSVLEELKIDLNDPESVEDITENVQQTLNVIETKKIIDDEL